CGTGLEPQPGRNRHPRIEGRATKPAGRPGHGPAASTGWHPIRVAGTLFADTALPVACCWPDCAPVFGPCHFAAGKSSTGPAVKLVAVDPRTGYSAAPIHPIQFAGTRRDVERTIHADRSTGTRVP